MELSETDKREVADSLRKLRGGVATPIETLDRLYSLGVWSRGTTRTRGTQARSAQNRLPNPNEIDTILSNLRTADPEIRQKAALVLGQWGGGECIETLRNVLSSAETDSVTRLYCVSALRNIGGATSVAAIIEAMKQREPEVQDAALSALSDLQDADANQTLSEITRTELQGILNDLKTSSSAPLGLRFRATEALTFFVQMPLVATATLSLIDRVAAEIRKFSLVFDPIRQFAFEMGPISPVMETAGDWTLEVKGVSKGVVRVSVKAKEDSLRGSRVRLVLIDKQTKKEIDSIEAALNKENQMLFEWRLEREKLPSQLPEKLQIEAYLL